MERQKIGGVIVSDMNHTNYGSALQAYATVKAVQEFGYNLSIIKYRKQRSFIEKLWITPQYFLCGGLKRTLRGIKTAIYMRIKKEYAKGQRVRRQATNGFKETELVPLFVEYKGYPALCKGSGDYDAVFVGSDQTWNPIGFYSNYWNLMFVDDRIPKFSYAASFGVSRVPAIQRKGTKKYLERLDMISVREDKGKRIIESISDRQATVVVDPTMLLSRDKWVEFAGKSDRQIEGSYIFCYFLGPRRDIREAAVKLSKDTGCKIVICPHMEEYRKADEGIGDYVLYDLNPYDFVKILSEAKYVCTDSFHGTVFSIMMHRKFMTFYRDTWTSTNSRIDNLLGFLGLEDRLYKGDMSLINGEIDYKLVDERLAQKREESEAFFKNALSLSSK
jgi:hypothetical protein